jgi:hypothetical protein
MRAILKAGLVCSLFAAVVAPAMANASIRPDAVTFGSGSSALKSGERKSPAAAANNDLKARDATVTLLAAAAAGLGLYWALRDHDDKPVSPS